MTSEKKEEEVNKDSLVGIVDRDSFEESEFMPPSIVRSSYYSNEDKE